MIGFSFHSSTHEKKFFLYIISYTKQGKMGKIVKKKKDKRWHVNVFHGVACGEFTLAP